MALDGFWMDGHVVGVCGQGREMKKQQNAFNERLFIMLL